MLVDPVVGFVGKSVIVGGALAGGLHAVSGPDHFPALLPRCMGQQLMPAAKIGVCVFVCTRARVCVSMCVCVCVRARARVCVRVCTFARVHTHSPVQGVNKCFTRTGTHTGSLWGLGHAMSAMAMGLAIFLLKERTISSHTALGKVAFGADIAIGDVHAHAHDMHAHGRKYIIA